MRFSSSEAKRQSNLTDHGLDFVDAAGVFEGVTYAFEDDRFDYGERRFMTLGLLDGDGCIHRAHRIATSHSHQFISQGDQT